MEEIHGKSVLIVGFGREGQQILEYLCEEYPHLRIAVADKKMPFSRENDGVKWYSGDSYLSHLAEFDTVIRSPGVSPFQKEFGDYRKAGGWITSPTNIFFSKAKGVVIGVTGTKGKSTTASLIAAMLSQEKQDVRLVGNIGTPMMSALPDATDETVFVVELSSHQLVDCRYSPQIAVLLEIVPEHLDYYPEFLAYTRAKGEIAAHQEQDGVVIVNPQHSESLTQARRSPGSLLLYAEQKIPGAHIWIENDCVVGEYQQEHAEICCLSDLPLLGNRENILAATNVALFMGVTPASIKKALMAFSPLPHRLSIVGTYRGIRFINDSLATTPEAAIHALRALGGSVSTLIVGGFDRGLSYEKLMAFLPESGVKTIVTLPPSGLRIAQDIAERNIAVSVYHADTLQKAVELSFAYTKSGETCLLSPAAASYGMFENYADRGNQFVLAVRQFGTAL